MVTALFDWWVNREGATAIEYGLIAAGISLAIAGAVYGFGDSLYAMFYSALPTQIGQ